MILRNKYEILNVLFPGVAVLSSVYIDNLTLGIDNIVHNFTLDISSYIDV